LKMSKKFKLLILLACALILVPVSFLGILYYEVTHDTASRIEKGAIDRVIFSESPVYYDDGVTPIGVFFEKTHRKYIQYDEIPKAFIKAIVATEDKNFFYHHGVDFKAVLRALIANVRAGQVVEGGSTLTQQTAKNIFKREKRSYMTKLKELVQAFLLEREYTKEQILEMYCNQFFVTGFGKGLRIAAQYFFDKDAKDLDLVEAAFIAGSVKAPNRYNPFIKKTQAEKEEARRLAKVRKDHVLSSMLKMNFISREQFAEAIKREVPFKEGTITYRLNVVLDYIREQLESDYFTGILKEQGVDNIATSGITIYTSLNKEIQEAALRSLRSHLPEMDTRLTGYDLKQMAYSDEEFPEKLRRKSTDGLPFLARITHLDTSRQSAHLVVAWDGGGGVIGYEGLTPMGEAWLKWKEGTWAVFDKKDVPSFLRNFQIGDLVPVRTESASDGKEEARLVLSKIPQLEGGIVVLRNGMLKAMVGGFFDRFFNRAVDAKRQLGSIFKPLVYAAALQLKWNNLDSLVNMKDIFEYEGTIYLPRPDHTPQSQKVSMTWAGAKSENLATVWLLYHLTDRLNMREFREVTNRLGLGQKEDESYLDYKTRIRDRFGVVVNQEALMQAAFEECKKDVVSDIIFSGNEEMLNHVNRLHLNIDRNAIDPEALDDPRILRFSFRKLQELDIKMKDQLQTIALLLERYLLDKSPALRLRLAEVLHPFYRVETGGGTETSIIYTENPGLLSYPTLIPLTPEWLMERREALSKGGILIDGLVASKILETMQERLKRNYETLLSQKHYDLDVLAKIQDFRTLVNLNYVARLARDLGVSTKLDPVLSFPLGANSISIVEAALAYQSMMTGRTFPFKGNTGASMVPAITKILDRNGEVLYEHKPQTRKVLSDRVSTLVNEILRKVIENGTGRMAKDAVQILFSVDNLHVGVPIPCFGKTGTSNRYTNSSFVGFFPGPEQDSGKLTLPEGYVVASYVGYDDNRPMKAKYYTVYGSSGALPLWIDTANAIVNSSDFRKNVQPADLAFSSLRSLLVKDSQTFREIPVSPVSGLPLHLSHQASGPSTFPRVLTDLEDPVDTLTFKRSFEPLKGEIE
jgi:penicillin-binding protein 1A